MYEVNAHLLLLKVHQLPACVRQHAELECLQKSQACPFRWEGPPASAVHLVYDQQSRLCLHNGAAVVRETECQKALNFLEWVVRELWLPVAWEQTTV